MRKAKKDFYYHVTDCDLGYEPYLNPANPNALVHCVPNEDDWIYKISVSPSIIKCLLAIFNTLRPSSKIRVYRTARKISPYIPHKIYDLSLTNERWILDKRKFFYIGSLNVKDIENSIPSILNVESFEFDEYEKKLKMKLLANLIIKQSNKINLYQERLFGKDYIK